MTNKRKKYTSEFKAQVALAALSGEKSVSEIAHDLYVSVHRTLTLPNLITNWKIHLRNDKTYTQPSTGRLRSWKQAGGSG